MGEKFNSVPVEDDTKIIFQLECSFGKYDVLYQKWFWDGIMAESIIFDDEDVSELNDEEIEAELRESPLIKKANSCITIKRSESGFTFVNFNFELAQ